MNIQQQVIAIFCDSVEHSVDRDTLDLTMPLKNMPYIDSLTLLKFVSAIEARYKVSVAMNEVDQVFRSIGSVVAYIEAHHST